MTQEEIWARAIINGFPGTVIEHIDTDLADFDAPLKVMVKPPEFRRYLNTAMEVPEDGFETLEIVTELTRPQIQESYPGSTLAEWDDAGGHSVNRIFPKEDTEFEGDCWLDLSFSPAINETVNWEDARLLRTPYENVEVYLPDWKDDHLNIP